MAKAEPKATEVTSVTGRPGTMAMHLSDEEFDKMPDELKEQISRSPAPKDSIGYYFDKMVATLKAEDDEKDRQFNVKDVLVWAWQQNNDRVFKIQSVRTVLKKRLEEGQITEVAGTPGRDKVYQVVV